MKRVIQYLVIFTIILSLSVSVMAGDVENKKQITENTILSLLEGLNSDNLGLRTSCAYMLGELKFSGSVIPLMQVLREDKNEEARISAALALYKIGTPLSINAVKQAIKFDNCDRVSKHASDFYNEYLRNKLRNEGKLDDITNVTLK